MLDRIFKMCTRILVLLLTACISTKSVVSDVAEIANETMSDATDAVRTVVNTTSIVEGLLSSLNSGNISDIFNTVYSLQEDSATSVYNLLLSEGELLDLPLGTGLPTPELIEAYGYPVEIHEVTTEDGYILTLHRIPHGKNGSNSSDSKSVVFIMPGLTGDAACFLTDSYEKNLPYALADNGYDVWLCNPRGTRYSRKHVNQSLTVAQYFNFTLTEKGIYDVPTSIDYILNNTEQGQLLYIGHSEGTTNFLILTSEKPEYNQKIRLASLMAPTSYMNHTKQLIFIAASTIINTLRALLETLGIYSIGDLTIYFDILAVVLCNDESPVQEACQALVDLFSSVDPDQANQTLLPLFFTHSPNAGSTLEFIHYGQLIKSGNFCYYDYGPQGNLEEYGSSYPPNFNISNIIVPVALYYGPGDIITTPTDVQRLASELPNLVRNYSVQHEQFGHIDFLLAKDLDTLVNDELIEFLSNY